MAGLGRKLFTRGTLSSGDVQGYLMDQSVMVFPSASARAGDISTPTEGMVSYLKDVKRLEVYEGAAGSGGAWRRRLRAVDGGTIALTTSPGGDVLINHALGAVPTRYWVDAIGLGNDGVYGKALVTAATTTALAVRLIDTRSGSPVVNLPSNFVWGADLL